MTGTVTVRARDRQCPACGGIGGRHTILGCGALREQAARELPRSKSTTSPKEGSK